MTDDDRKLRDLVWGWFFADRPITLTEYDWMLRQGLPAFNAAFDEADRLWAHEGDLLEDRRQRAIAGLDEVIERQLAAAKSAQVFVEEFDAALARARARQAERRGGSA